MVVDFAMVEQKLENEKNASKLRKAREKRHLKSTFTTIVNLALKFMAY